MWQYRGHDGAANQYPDWKTEGHATALSDLKAVMGPNPPASCLECHSADYRIAVGVGQDPADRRSGPVRHHLRRLPHAARQGYGHG